MTWPTKKLGEIISFEKGKKMTTASAGEPYIGIDGLRTNQYSIYTQEKNGIRCESDDVLLVWDGAHAGTVGTGLNGFVGSTIVKVLSDNSLDNKFLFYLLKLSQEKIRAAAQGAAIPHLNKAFINSIKIPLPSLAAQKQIVERLDKIAEAQKLNDELIQKSDELFQSLLHQELNPAGKNWEVKKLVEVADFLDNLRRPVTASDRVPGPYPYYGANGQQDSVSDYIFDDELVLLAEDGGYFGSKNRSVAYRVSGKCWVNNHAHVLKNKAEISDIDFLGYSLMFYDVTPYITGSTRAKLNKSAAEKIKIPIPFLETQKQIVAKLSAVRDYKKQLLEQKSKLKELFDSSLAKSMSGR